MDQLSFKTITATVRPPRIAALVDASDPHWQNTCIRIIEFFTQLWGGHYNIIVPTDGKTIEPQFWAFLNAFSPDYVYAYQATGRDLKTNEPPKFEAWLAKEIQQAQAGRKWVEEALENAPLAPRVEDKLSTDVRDRLIPFYFQDNIIGAFHYGAESYFPLTGTLNLLSLWPPPLVMEIPSRSTDKISDLWLASAFGAISSKYREKLDQAHVLKSPSDVNERNLQATVIEAAEWDQTSRPVPFSLCRTNLSSYRSTRFRAFSEPAIAILGGTLRDFCFVPVPVTTTRGRRMVATRPR